MAARILACLLFSAAIINLVNCNLEGDVLHLWRSELEDPFNVLQSWDPTLVNPCTWLHITCNSENSVVRVDLGNAGLSGPLIPQLGLLSNLQYLEVYSNNLTGAIPRTIANLTKLVSLDLYQNQLTGRIPVSLGNLLSLRYMRLNSNKLSGTIPFPVINLIVRGNLMILNVSDNFLAGTVHRSNNLTSFATTTIIQDPKAP